MAVLEKVQCFCYMFQYITSFLNILGTFGVSILNLSGVFIQPFPKKIYVWVGKWTTEIRKFVVFLRLSTPVSVFKTTADFQVELAEITKAFYKAQG